MMSDAITSLRRAITTASNDDTSTTGSDRHAQRISAMQDAVEAIERLRSYAIEVTRALTGLTVGGSEFFKGHKMGFYEADIPACIKNVNWRMEQRGILAAAKARHEMREIQREGGSDG